MGLAKRSKRWVICTADLHLNMIADEANRASIRLQEGLQDKLKNSCELLAPIIYRDHLENFDRESLDKSFSILTLVKDSQFCVQYTESIFDEVFINNVLLEIYGTANGRHFAEAVAYIYERIQPKLIDISQWSQNEIDKLNNGHPAKVVGSRRIWPDSDKNRPVTASALYEQFARQHPKFKDDGNLLENFKADVVPLTWLNSEDLKGPSFPEIGSIFY
jgi:hypothetical protein